MHLQVYMGLNIVRMKKSHINSSEINSTSCVKLEFISLQLTQHENQITNGHHMLEWNNWYVTYIPPDELIFNTTFNINFKKYFDLDPMHYADSTMSHIFLKTKMNSHLHPMI